MSTPAGRPSATEQVTNGPMRRSKRWLAGAFCRPPGPLVHPLTHLSIDGEFGTPPQVHSVDARNASPAYAFEGQNWRPACVRARREVPIKMLRSECDARQRIEEAAAS
jgi:hypothetical protein